MRVIVNRNVNFGMEVYDFWFVLDAPTTDKRLIGVLVPQEDGPAVMEWQEQAEGAVVEATFRLPPQAVDMLRQSIDELGPTTTGHLTFVRDVIGVRDRLLTLVEKLAVSGSEG